MKLLPRSNLPCAFESTCCIFSSKHIKTRLRTHLNPLPRKSWVWKLRGKRRRKSVSVSREIKQTPKPWSDRGCSRLGWHCYGCGDPGGPSSLPCPDQFCDTHVGLEANLPVVERLSLLTETMKIPYSISRSQSPVCSRQSRSPYSRHWSPVCWNRYRRSRSPHRWSLRWDDLGRWERNMSPPRRYDQGNFRDDSEWSYGCDGGVPAWNMGPPDWVWLLVVALRSTAQVGPVLPHLLAHHYCLFPKRWQDP